MWLSIFLKYSSLQKIIQLVVIRTQLNDMIKKFNVFQRIFGVFSLDEIVFIFAS